MGFWDSVTDMVEAAMPWTTVEAEAVSGGTGTDSTPAQPNDAGEGEAKVSSILHYGLFGTSGKGIGHVEAWMA
jgi:hypothetical protein